MALAGFEIATAAALPGSTDASPAQPSGAGVGAAQKADGTAALVSRGGRAKLRAAEAVRPKQAWVHCCVPCGSARAVQCAHMCSSRIHPMAWPHWRLRCRRKRQRAKAPSSLRSTICARAASRRTLARAAPAAPKARAWALANMAEYSRVLRPGFYRPKRRPRPLGADRTGFTRRRHMAAPPLSCMPAQSHGLGAAEAL